MQLLNPHPLAKRSVRAAGLGAVALFMLSLLNGCGEEKPSTQGPSQEKQNVVVAIASAKGRVDIEGGVIRLAARRDGVISSVLVEEGARVTAGQTLATLDDALAQRNVSLTRSEAKQVEQEIKKAEVELLASEREMKRMEYLAKDETVPRQDYDRACDTHALAGVALQAARVAFATAQARESVAVRELEERKIVAPLNGQIIQRQARPGNGVSTLNVTPLFLFVPDVPRIVRAELEEQYLPVVTSGQRTEVVLEADASRKWSGQVIRIGKVVGQRTPSEDPAERQDNRVVEVVISLDAEDLLIGQRVIVRFLKR